MWILDSRARTDIELWEWSNEGVRHLCEPYDACFYLCLADPALHREMLEALEEEYRAEECRFRTIFGEERGYRIHAGRAVAEAIERQTRYTATLYNVDVRPDQQFMAERGLLPCGGTLESRFIPDTSCPLSALEIAVDGDPHRTTGIAGIRIAGDREERLTGTEAGILADLASIVAVTDPDVLLFPNAGLWIPRIRQKATAAGLAVPFSRTGSYRTIASRSYWSYGRVEYKTAACVPDGRILVDTANSFVYREGGLPGVLLAARLTGLAPSMAAHVTPGTLISAYEVYEALRRGIAVPFRKSDAERVRAFCELKALDRGGLILQPVPGLYEGVTALDFTSLYPSLIVKHNLSPESLGASSGRGFLPDVLEPLLDLRRETKRRKGGDPALAGLDAVLKWMLVTCFGYTGYKNAKFGRIEVHEQITRHARETLLIAKNCAEGLGLRVVHGIVDSLWVQGAGVGQFAEAVLKATGLSAELEVYDWIVFLPMDDGFGAYNRYYGRLTAGEIKYRGVMARRGDTPAYVKQMQQALFESLGSAESIEALGLCADRAAACYRAHRDGLSGAAPDGLAIFHRISRIDF
ncbi:MAG: type B DNA-directed DNA polymerase [Methanobacteriota archaeon]|nr:MAG: type B DNA-directed DNA polymerase [Euryarchaeota archaeon]